MENKVIGRTGTPSTTQKIQINILRDNGLIEIKDKLVYFDVVTEELETYRALGFVHEVTTSNDSPRAASEALMNLTSDIYGSESKEILSGRDNRTVELHVIATFCRNAAGQWTGQRPLPTSPSSSTNVYIASQKDIHEMFATKLTKGDNIISSIGNLRGAKDIVAPMILPYFGGSRGASSIAIVGKTGSGKTDFTSKMLINMFAHPDHFALVVDPQGQWGNENGFTISVQKTAQAMGREVHNLRVSENIMLPLDEDNLMNMLNQIDIWAKVGRMAKENRDLLSLEVAELIVDMPRRRINSCKEDKDYRALLTEVLNHIANSPATVRRIYASDDRQATFVDSLRGLTDPALLLIADKSNGIIKKDALEYTDAVDELLEMGAIEKNTEQNPLTEYVLPANDPERAKNEQRWNGVLNKFIPLLNLFQTHNLGGGRRIPFAGPGGFLENVLKVRNPNQDEPAPYVILDMSPDTVTNAKATMMGDKNPLLNMRKLLDNDNIKASILMMIFSSLKEAAEDVFSSGAGNLNTQILFDEAWRYAPERSDNEIIMKLSKMLEGFALDTRKFGIGWTYILQSPSDLRQGIWKQLKFAFAGYGLVGSDLARMGDLMDDASNQLNTYKQFVSPDLSGEYPFMLVGSVSPLITAQVPLFINSFNTVEDYFDANKEWLEGNMRAAGKPIVEVGQLTPGKASKKASEASTAYSVGSGATKEETGFISQFKPEENNERIAYEDDLDLPF